MTKKLAINGIEIGVEDDKADKLIKMLKEDGFRVDDLEDCEANRFNEPYDYYTCIKNTQNYSDTNPENAEQYLFWKMAWDAATMCIKEYYLKHFGVWILTHSAKDTLLDSICAGLNGEQGAKIADIWAEVEESRSNFYEMEFAPKHKRETLLELIKELYVIIEQANLEDVKSDFESLQSITLRD